MSLTNRDLLDSLKRKLIQAAGTLRHLGGLSKEDAEEVRELVHDLSGALAMAQHFGTAVTATIPPHPAANVVYQSVVINGQEFPLREPVDFFAEREECGADTPVIMEAP